MCFVVVCVFQASSELWLVGEDYTAASDREISVSRGQQVELVEAHPSSAPDSHLIRLVNPDTADWASAEGLVPANILKPVSGVKLSQSRTSIAIDNNSATGGGINEGTLHKKNVNRNILGMNL